MIHIAQDFIDAEPAEAWRCLLNIIRDESWKVWINDEGGLSLVRNPPESLNPPPDDPPLSRRRPYVGPAEDARLPEQIV
jgi:hypothetical protein